MEQKLIPVVILSTAVLVAASAFAYYLVVFIPQREINKNKLELEKVKYQETLNEQNRTKYKACADKVIEDYHDAWNRQCKTLGKDDSCLLDEPHAKRLDERKSEKSESCHILYPIK